MSSNYSGHCFIKHTLTQTMKLAPSRTDMHILLQKKVCFQRHVSELACTKILFFPHIKLAREQNGERERDGLRGVG